MGPSSNLAGRPFAPERANGEQTSVVRANLRAMTEQPPPHPVVWAILYIPFGALSGFVQVALTFQATRHGLSISDAAYLSGAILLSQWLKWLWAPVVDITLSPKRWYTIATTTSAVAVMGMASIPMSKDTFGFLILVIATASLINTIVGMSTEAMMARVTPRSEIGRVSGWFQAGNLGGTGLGGGLGLLLMEELPAAWMSGAVVGLLFLACNLALFAVPAVAAHQNSEGPLAAVKQVIRDLGAMLRTRSGRLSALLCFLPIGTGAAQVVLSQAEIAARWGAGATEVARVQGFGTGIVTAIGCFAGGWLCQRMPPRTQYVSVSLVLACIAVGMGLSPATVTMYVTWSFIYAFCVGLTYAGFTAVVLDAMGPGSAATKFNVYGSLSNFPIWWVGLALGAVAERAGPVNMLYAEATLCVVGVVVFLTGTWLLKAEPAS